MMWKQNKYEGDINMACTIKADEIKRVKALGFLNNKGTDCFNARVITVMVRLQLSRLA